MTRNLHPLGLVGVPMQREPETCASVSLRIRSKLKGFTVGVLTWLVLRIEPIHPQSRFSITESYVQQVSIQSCAPKEI